MKTPQSIRKFLWTNFYFSVLRQLRIYGWQNLKKQHFKICLKKCHKNYHGGQFMS